MGGWRSIAVLAVLRDELLELVAVMLERAFVLNTGRFVALLLHLRLLVAVAGHLCTTGATARASPA
jgi:hypothetical protein